MPSDACGAAGFLVNLRGIGAEFAHFPEYHPALARKAGEQVERGTQGLVGLAL